MTIAGIVIVTFLHLIYARSKSRRRKEIRQLSQQLANTSNQYKKAKDELDTMTTDIVAFKDRKQQELAELQAQLEDVMKQYGNLQQREQFEALMQQPIITTIMQRLKSRKPLTESECILLTEAIKQYLPLLHIRLTNGNPLGILGLRVAILTRLNFQPDSIAILLNVSKQSVSNAQLRVNKKLFSGDSARSLHKNLTYL